MKYTDFDPKDSHCWRRRVMDLLRNNPPQSLSQLTKPRIDDGGGGGSSQDTSGFLYRALVEGWVKQTTKDEDDDLTLWTITDVGREFLENVDAALKRDVEERNRARRERQQQQAAEMFQEISNDRHVEKVIATLEEYASAAKKGSWIGVKMSLLPETGDVQLVIGGYWPANRVREDTTTKRRP